MGTQVAANWSRKPANPRIRNIYKRDLFRASNFTHGSRFLSSPDALSPSNGVPTGTPELRGGAFGPHLWTKGNTQAYLSLGAFKSFTEGFTAVVHFRVDPNEQTLTNTDRLFGNSTTDTNFYLAPNNISGDEGALNYRHNQLSAGNTQFSTPTRYWTTFRPRNVIASYNLARVELYADGLHLGGAARTGTFDLSADTLTHSQNGSGDRFGGEIFKSFIFQRGLGHGECITLGRKINRVYAKKPTFSYPPDGGLGILPSGIVTAESFGTPAITTGGVTVSPTGISSAETFGAMLVETFNAITPNGIASAEVFGAPVITPGTVVILPSSIGSAEAFGNPTLSQAVIITPSSIGSAEAFGSHTITPGNVFIVPIGIVSAEIFGAHTVGDIVVVSDEVFSGIIRGINRGVRTGMRGGTRRP